MTQAVVAGAGAIGLAVALALAKDGVSVTVRDPAPLGANASGVAAGMLAPVFEAALDPLSANHLPLLMAARDLWPALAEETGVMLDRSGAVYRGARAVEVVSTGDDWRLAPMQALIALKAAAERAGVRFEARAARPGEDALLIAATGPARDLAPELAVLAPVKGHILRFAGGPSAGPVVRGDGVYVCPDPEGAVAGATMEAGEAGLEVDPAKVAALRRAAEALVPELAGLEAVPGTGVRAATPDGLPLVGWTARPGVLVTAGARRNGWLLAPLVARMAAAYLRGGDPGPFAGALDARRFSGGALS